MKIAYASENPKELEQIGAYLHSYYDTLHIPVEVCLFNDPELLFESVQHTVYKLIMLNLDYVNTNGIMLHYRIRRFMPHVAIVLLRVLEDGKVACILANPSVFLLPDLSEQSFKPMLDAVRSSVGSHPERTILINTTQNLERIVPLKDITYAESMGHRVFVHLSAGDLLETQGPIKLLQDRLSEYPEFLFPHRSYIVNAFYVSCIMPDSLLMRMPQTTIPIARGKLTAVKTRYEAFYKLFNDSIYLQSNARMDP